MLVFFRGKAATGKSTMANYLANNYGLKVLDKDSIFDQLLNQGIDWDTATQTTYDHLIKAIQCNHDKEIPTVVDIGLSHTPFFEDFIGKLRLDMSGVHLFLFTCSDDDIWLNRIQKRIDNPEGPNQCIWATTDAKAHYDKYDINLLKTEVEIDSKHDFSKLTKQISLVIGIA